MKNTGWTRDIGDHVLIVNGIERARLPFDPRKFSCELRPAIELALGLDLSAEMPLLHKPPLRRAPVKPC